MEENDVHRTTVFGVIAFKNLNNLRAERQSLHFQFSGNLDNPKVSRFQAKSF